VDQVVQAAPVALAISQRVAALHLTLMAMAGAGKTIKAVLSAVRAGIAAVQVASVIGTVLTTRYALAQAVDGVGKIVRVVFPPVRVIPNKVASFVWHGE